MNFNKYFMITMLCVTNFNCILFAPLPTDNTGFYLNLSSDEKMHLIIAALDEGLFQIFANYQSNQSVEQLNYLVSIGIEKNKSLFTALGVQIPTSVQYLTFLAYAFFLSKYGKTAAYLGTLTEAQRTTLFNLCYECWQTNYTDQLTLNKADMLADLTYFFANVWQP